MGTGTDFAREDAPEHAAMIDNMKDQLLIVLMDRLKDDTGHVVIPTAEIDATGNKIVEFHVDFAAKQFIFRVIHKS